MPGHPEPDGEGKARATHWPRQHSSAERGELGPEEAGDPREVRHPAPLTNSLTEVLAPTRAGPSPRSQATLVRRRLGPEPPQARPVTPPVRQSMRWRLGVPASRYCLRRRAVPRTDRRALEPPAGQTLEISLELCSSWRSSRRGGVFRPRPAWNVSSAQARKHAAPSDVFQLAAARSIIDPVDGTT